MAAKEVATAGDRGDRGGDWPLGHLSAGWLVIVDRK
jgi:hypothetical protein